MHFEYFIFGSFAGKEWMLLIFKAQYSVYEFNLQAAPILFYLFNH